VQGDWLILFFAGLREVVWAVGLRLTDGFARPVPSFVTLVAMAGSFHLLSLAMRDLPLSTDYSVWVGIGVVGAAISGVLLFHESVSTLRFVSLLLVIAGNGGLKLASAS
jgi:quaternary ammonium compound-resistance protein SugE